MCLAIPMELVEQHELEGVVELSGVRRTVSLMLLPEAKLGDWVLVHAGYAIGTVQPDEARETLALLAQFADAVEEF